MYERATVKDPVEARKMLDRGEIVGRQKVRSVEAALRRSKKLKPQEALLFHERHAYALSNFSAHAVEFEVASRVYLFMTAEHAYQASKFTDEKIINKIGMALSPAKAKEIAHAHREFYRPDWSEEVKLDLMARLTWAKLIQHRDEIEPILLLSGEQYIVENSTQDSFWGWGSDKKGLNHLGEIWMKHRSELRRQRRNRI